jgi:hypothetical protein
MGLLLNTAHKLRLQPLLETECVTNIPSEPIFPELRNIYLNPDIKSVSEVYGQRLYTSDKM